MDYNITSGGRGGLGVRAMIAKQGNEGWPGITSKAVEKKQHPLANNTA